MFEIKDIVQIILIPILTIILASILDSSKEKRKRNSTKDKELFELLKGLFEGKNDLILFFRDHSVGNHTHRDYISKVNKLEHEIVLPGFVFSNRRLEKSRKKLHAKTDEFISHTAANFLPLKNRPDYYDLRYKKDADLNPETFTKFKELYSMIDKIGTEIYEIYNEMASIAQKKL